MAQLRVTITCCQPGARFSRNALNPSRPSSESRTSAISLTVLAITSSLMPAARDVNRQLLAASQRGGRIFQQALSQRRNGGVQLILGHDLAEKPQRPASSPCTGWPLINSRRAAFSPMVFTT